MFVDTSGLSGGGRGGRRRKPPKSSKKPIKKNNVLRLGSDYDRLNSQFPERTLTEETVDVDNT